MKKIVNKVKPKSEFTRNVLTLMTGAGVAQIVPIIISPILTRIYTPEDFGVLALFVAIVSIIASVASGRYELAIMLPKKDGDATNLLALGFVFACVTSCITLFVVICFYKTLSETLGLWLYALPFAVFFTGVWNLLNFFNNRKKEYRKLARTNVERSVFLAIIQLTIGFIVKGSYGLVSGQVFSQAYASTRLFLISGINTQVLSAISWLKMIALAKKYKDFFKYSILAVLANALSIHLANIFISSMYGLVALGFYALVQRTLGMPGVLLGSAFGQVIFQQAVSEKQQTGKALKTFKYAVIRLSLIGLLLFSCIYFFVEGLFAYVFGEEWRTAGEYAKILVPLFYVRFVSSALSCFLSVFEKQFAELMINLLLVSTSVILFMLCKDIFSFLFYSSIFMSLNYIAFLFYYYKLARGEDD